jgi:hypothetical protein
LGEGGRWVFECEELGVLTRVAGGASGEVNVYVVVMGCWENIRAGENFEKLWF